MILEEFSRKVDYSRSSFFRDFMLMHLKTTATTYINK